jgi:hypothetical protein
VKQQSGDASTQARSTQIHRTMTKEENSRLGSLDDDNMQETGRTVCTTAGDAVNTHMGW